MGTSKLLNLWLRVHCRGQSGKVGGVKSIRMSSVKVSHRNGCTNKSRTIQKRKRKEKNASGGDMGGIGRRGMRGTRGRKGKGEVTSCLKKLFIIELIDLDSHRHGYSLHWLL